MTRPRYTAETDGLKTKAIVLHRDDGTDRTIVTGLPAADAEQLARDWSRHEPPGVKR